MENQVSGPLGTDVCSPLNSSQSATEAVQEPGPTHDTLQPQVIHTWNRGRRTLLIGWNRKQAKGKEKHSVACVDKTSVWQTHNQCKAEVIRGYRSAVYSLFLKPKHSFILQLSTGVHIRDYKTAHDTPSRASLLLCILEDILRYQLWEWQGDFYVNFFTPQ